MTEPCCCLFWTVRGLLGCSGCHGTLEVAPCFGHCPPAPICTVEGGWVSLGCAPLPCTPPPHRACWGQVRGGQQPLPCGTRPPSGVLRRLLMDVGRVVGLLWRDLASPRSPFRGTPSPGPRCPVLSGTLFLPHQPWRRGGQPPFLRLGPRFILGLPTVAPPRFPLARVPGSPSSREGRQCPQLGIPAGMPPSQAQPGCAGVPPGVLTGPTASLGGLLCLCHHRHHPVPRCHRGSWKQQVRGAPRCRECPTSGGAGAAGDGAGRGVEG